MNDVLPADAALWELFENTVQSVLKSYGYQQIRTPIVEPTSLFARGSGTVTDIVEKETSKGPIVLVVTESEYRTGAGELLIRTRRTQIRRK